MLPLETIEVLRRARGASSEHLRQRIANLEDEVCDGDTSQSERRYAQELIGVYEHVLDERAGRIDLTTGERIERKDDEEEDSDAL